MELRQRLKLMSCPYYELRLLSFAQTIAIRENFTKKVEKYFNKTLVS
jgi:hypothetical protein